MRSTTKHRRRFGILLIGCLALLLPALGSAQTRERRILVLPVTVPDVQGKPFEEARAVLERLGLQAEEANRIENAAPAGTVVTQDPQPNIRVARGSTVHVTISIGRTAPPSGMPDLYGMRVQQATEILARLRIRLQIAGTEPSSQPTETIIAQDPRAHERLTAERIVKVTLAAAPPPRRVVPNVAGMQLETAVQVLSKTGLATGQLTRRPGEARAGTVIDQYPLAGQIAEPRSPVNLTISDGPAPPQPSAPKRTVVPDLRTQTEDAARRALARRQLVLGQSERTLDPSPDGLIFDQNPPPGAAVPPGTRVDVRISSGGVLIPDLTGRTRDSATQVIADSRLRVGEIRTMESAEPAGRVIDQDPRAGTLVNADAAVALLVSTGPAHPASITVPNVVGLTTEDARTTLEASGLRAGSLKQQASAQPAGTVVDQGPTAGSRAVPGKLVQLFVSAPRQATAPVVVPDVTGLPLGKARDILAAAQLPYALDSTSGPANENAIVSRQAPPAYERVQPGTTIQLALSSTTAWTPLLWLGGVGLAAVLWTLAYALGKKRLGLPRHTEPSDLLRMSLVLRRDYGSPRVTLKMNHGSALDMSLGLRAVSDPGRQSIRVPGSNLPKE